MTDTRQIILVVDDDPLVTDALALMLEREGRTTIVCSDIESAEIALAQFPVTHLLSDVQFSGDFTFEGFHFLSRAHSLRPECRLILMTGLDDRALDAAAIAHGAVTVLHKPFGAVELEKVIDPPTQGDDSQLIRIPPIDEILGGGVLASVFQPIVRFGAGGPSTYGYEALTRVRGRWLLGGPTSLFDYADRRSRLAELNLAALRQAMESASMLHSGLSLFVNLDPQAFHAPGVATSIIAAARTAGIGADRLVLEVTERSALSSDERVLTAFDAMREAGVRFAFDDHGSAYSHLALISRVRPSFIKISHTFGSGFEQDHVKGRIVRHTIALARDFGCETILEGIETAATARAAVEAGVNFAQGFHFGKPHAATRWTSGRASLDAA